MNLIPPELQEHYDKIKNDVLTDPALKLTHKYYEWTP
jgi:hypothetical protein